MKIKIGIIFSLFCLLFFFAKNNNPYIFHTIDIWDHDDESCVLDAVSRLNEVRTVRGLGKHI